jgi:tetratricopeptide (TPR) repeat protein
MSESSHLSSVDARHLEAAEGWLGLGNWGEAQLELEQISSVGQGHPGVLRARWEACAAARKWPEALELAAALIQSTPHEPTGWVHRSYCLHELKRTQEARDNLLRVVDTFKGDPTIRYNLACYECQMGRLEQARAWLRKACEVGLAPRIWQMALEDPDLAPLREEIALTLRPADPESQPERDD